MSNTAAVSPKTLVTGATCYVPKGTRSTVAVPYCYAYHFVALRITSGKGAVS